MPSRASLTILALLCLYGGWQSWQQRELHQPPGVLVDALPRQEMLEVPVETLKKHGFDLLPQARYDIEARLLSRERYYLGVGARLAPLDFALGWGVMSDSAVLDTIDVSQSARYFHVRWERPPVEAEQIMHNSANVHLIAADSSIQRRLDSMRPGQHIRLQGLLVNARREEDGWRWNTSLSRTDSGAGACELMWVQQADLL